VFRLPENTGKENVFESERLQVRGGIAENSITKNVINSSSVIVRTDQIGGKL
jgi:hypothetical protein